MDESQFEGLGSLVRLSGVNIPARARFVGESLVYSSLSGITLGMVCGQVGANILTCGPLVPFLFGSWAGYSFGLYAHWTTAKRLALFYAERYPTLMAHALWTERGINVPPSIVTASQEKQFEQAEEEEEPAKLSFNGGPVTLDQWICNGGMARLSWSILAAQSCRPDVEEVQRQQRQRLMEQHAEKFE